MKRCTKCNVEKPPEQFYRHSTMRDGLHSYCKPCFMKTNREWVRRNPEKSRSYVIKRRYAITQEEVKAILEQQDHRCAICCSPVEYLKTGHIDHDHVTKRVRGILCGSCNRAIGLLKDDDFIVSEAAAYLQNHREVSTNPESPNVSLS